MPKVTVLLLLICIANIGSVVSVHGQGLNLEALSDQCQLVEVHLEEKGQLELLAGMGFDIIESNQANLKVFASGDQMAWLKNMGFKTEIMDLSLVVDESLFGVAGAGLYHTYEEVMAELHQIESIYGGIAKVYDIGNSIEHREIWALKISDNPSIDEIGEPDVLYMGAHHAREWISVELPMYLANYLVTNYDRDPRVTTLVDEREIWIVPMVNPDGVDYSQKVYQMWRKNKRDNNDDGRFDRSLDGVDNNRNYGYMWGYDDVGSSPYPWSETFRGSSPFSEPENQAIRNLALQQEFVFAISYHSYGQLMLLPWGYIDEDTPDHKVFIDVAEKMGEFNGYLYGNAKDGVIYNTNGDAVDWLYGIMGTLAYTFELGTMFIPPESQIEEIWLRNKAPSLYLLQIADDPLQIYPSIKVYVDKTNYSEGDTMNVGLNLTNPMDAIDVSLYVWVDMPGGGKFWVTQRSLVTIPKDFEYGNPAWKSYILPMLPQGDYSWHAATLDPLTKYVLSESITPWKFEVN